MKYARMVKTTYNRNSPDVWVTHAVEDTLEQARTAQTEFERATRKLPGQGTTVVVYHSQEWERLVR